MTLEQALEFMQPSLNPPPRVGLGRITQLMHLLGDPQEQLHFVHVAGSNGKGSVCAMLSSILRCAGYTVGLYTSPHLLRIHERIQVNGAKVSDGELIELAHRVKEAADQLEEYPSMFERITAMALLYFKLRGCDVVVLEVGLGGRLDSTNVIPAPDAAVITNIALEHTELLGNTLEEIAREKGGIIKSGSSVVLYSQSQPVHQAIQQLCREREASLTITRPDRLRAGTSCLRGQRFSYGDWENLMIPLLGNHQLRNAAVALTCVEVLRQQRNYSIPDSAVEEGLLHTAWPGRLELLQEKPVVLLDGAHNPDGVEQLADAIAEYLPGRKVRVMMSVMADKDYRAMICLLAPYAKDFTATAIHYERALEPARLAQAIREETGLPVQQAADLRQALALLMEQCAPEDTVVIFGSLYQVGEVRAYFGKGL